MPQKIIDLLKKGVDANENDSFRQGNLISLPADVELIVTGDIHGHRRNFERIVSFADLENHHQRHVIFQEIIHGGPEDDKGGCLSYQLLFDVVRYKLMFPDQVHILIGNHDTSFINNSDVMKDGKEMNRAMRAAIDREFGEAGSDIKLAMKQLFFSQPLAVRTENKIWVSHSLPGDNYIDKFDEHILDRQLTANDMVKPGSAYLLTWGRNHSQALLDKIAGMFDVDIFVLGHQPQSEGWSRAGENLLIISSDHNHGCLLCAKPAESYSIEDLIEAIVPLASIG